MQCVKPVTLYTGIEPLVVPCGKCVACRIAKSREWALRLLWEGEAHQGLSLFVTLTFNDAHLPSPPTVERFRLQNFFKRLRKNVHPRKVKYYACGEYGDLTLRPHYHVILFGLKACLACCCCKDHKLPLPAEETDCRLIYDAWGQGHIDIGGVTYESARYVAGYVHKRRTHNYEPVSELQPPFGVQSQGLGLAFAEKHRDQLDQFLSATVHGVQVSIPRYFVRKMELDREALQNAAAQKELERLLGCGGVLFEEDVAKGNGQRKLNYEARLKLRERNL